MYEEVLEEGRGPRFPSSKGSKVPGSQGPRSHISNSHSNTSLTLKKVHLVLFCHKMKLGQLLESYAFYHQGLQIPGSTT